MSINTLGDVQFGMELPILKPDTSLASARRFAEAAGYAGSGRFEDHERARAQGLPGALVPGIMGMGFFVRMIHEWAPRGEVTHIDTVFRAPVLADHQHQVSAVVTEIDESANLVVLDLTIRNMQDETKVFGTATVRIPAT